MAGKVFFSVSMSLDGFIAPESLGVSVCNAEVVLVVHRDAVRPVQPLPSLAFRLLPVPGSDVARVAWEGESPHTADDLLRRTTNRELATALNAVRAWLRQALATGPRPAAELLAESESEGLSLASVRRARQIERIVVRKARGKHDGWIWSLPQADGKDAHPAPSPHLEHLAHLIGT